MLFLLHASSYLVLVDDAFISFRYAENWVRGLGLVFNEGERVEGYTNFLWVMLLALFHRLGVPTPLASQILGVTMAVLVVPVTYVAGRRACGLGSWASLVPTLAVAGSAAVARWAGGGLETPCYMTLFTLATALMITDLRHPPKFPASGILFGLAYLCRPEGAGMFAVACATALVVRAGSLRTILLMVVGFAAVFVPHMAFRLAYYGYPFPNTFYAKTSGGIFTLKAGLEYSASLLWHHGIWAVPFFFGAPLLAERRQRRLLFIPQAVLLFATAYVISVGGDFFKYFRFYVPYLPWFALLAAVGAWRVGTLLGKKEANLQRLAPALLLLLLLSVLIPAKFWTDKTFQKEKSLAEIDFTNAMRKKYGLFLRRQTPPDTLVAISALGVISYYSGLPTIDMLGLADEHIAHRDMQHDDGTVARGHFKYDSEYVLSRKPHLVVLDFDIYREDVPVQEVDLHTEEVYRRVLSLPTWWRSAGDLLGRREFRMHYVPRLVSLGEGFSVIYFERDESLPALAEAVSQERPDSGRFFQLAMRYRKQGLHEDAIHWLRLAARLDPRSVQLRRNIGFFLVESGKYEEASREFQNMRAYFPQDTGVLYGLALSLHRGGRYRQSIPLWREYLEKALVDDPYRLRALGFLAEAVAAAE
jgi:hypothetical protein